MFRLIWGRISAPVSIHKFLNFYKIWPNSSSIVISMMCQNMNLQFFQNSWSLVPMYFKKLLFRISIPELFFKSIIYVEGSLIHFFRLIRDQITYQIYFLSFQSLKCKLYKIEVSMYLSDPLVWTIFILSQKSMLCFISFRSRVLRCSLWSKKSLHWHNNKVRYAYKTDIGDFFYM